MLQNQIVKEYLNLPYEMVYMTLGLIWACLLSIGLAFGHAFYKQSTETKPAKKKHTRQFSNTAGKKRHRKKRGN